MVSRNGKIFTLLTTLIFLTVLSSCYAFDLGVNGHPFTQPSYKDISVQQQLDLVNEIGAKWYRVDCKSDILLPQNISKLRLLLFEAKKRNIKILPVIFPPIDLRKENDLNKIYDVSYEFSKTVASQLRGAVNVWELNNELDNFAILRKGEINYIGTLWNFDIPSGDKKEHYEINRAKKSIALLKGLADGIHAADPKAKRIIDATWVHFGFLELLSLNNVDYDIVGWHWYSDMGSITKVKGNVNLLSKLNSYKKPIWFTEINRRSGSQGSNGEAEQSRYLIENIESAQTNHIVRVENLFVYELLDEPHLGLSNPESFYGLVTVKNINGKWQIGNVKEGFRALMGFRQSNR